MRSADTAIRRYGGSVQYADTNGSDESMNRAHLTARTVKVGNNGQSDLSQKKRASPIRLGKKMLLIFMQAYA